MGSRLPHMLEALSAALLIAATLLLAGGSCFLVYRLINVPVTGGE